MTYSEEPEVKAIHAIGGYGYSAGLYGDFTFEDSITAPNVTVSTLLTATQFTDGFSEIGSGSADFAGNVTIVGTVSASNLSGTNTGDPITGTATLVAGTVTVSTASVVTASKILLTAQGSSTGHGSLWVDNIVNATSFDINSTNILDDSSVIWAILPA